jgi:hypothetical protein
LLSTRDVEHARDGPCACPKHIGRQKNKSGRAGTGRKTISADPGLETKFENNSGSRGKKPDWFTDILCYKCKKTIFLLVFMQNFLLIFFTLKIPKKLFLAVFQAK